MPHIHTTPNHHDLTVTAYIIRTDTPQPQALFHMHKILGVLLPVGGHVELHETPWQAVAHELEEESGYALEQLRVLQPVSRITKISKVVQHPQPLSINTHAMPGEHFHTDLQYAFTATSNPAHTVGEGESSDLRWLTQDELNALTPSEVYDGTKEIYNFIFNEALAHWDAVSTDAFLLTFPEEYK